MTELQLHKYINECLVEIHIYLNGTEMEDMSYLCDENWHEWTVWMILNSVCIDRLYEICLPSYFEDEGIKVIWKGKYFAIDLMDLMEYHEIEPKNIFNK